MRQLNSKKMSLAVVGIVTAMILAGGDIRADFTFGEPVNLGPLINSSAHEYSHCLSSDGLELYFGSSREGSLGSWDLWVATRTTTEDAWEEPKNLGQLINSPYADHAPILSSDGLELYFNSSRPGGIGSWDIWVTRRTTRDDSWGQPENLGAPVNSSYVEYNPTLSSDGLELYFAFSSEVDRWEPKIAVTKRDTLDAPWGNPVILDTVVNNWTWQDTPWISGDGLILMFTDYGWDEASPRPGGHGGTDIWFTGRTSKIAEWTNPLNLEDPINSAYNEDFPMISADGSTIYFNSNRPGGFGSQDLWQAPILPVVDFDDNGSVGMSDLLAMIGALDTDEQLYDIGPMPWGDGVVDEADLEILMEHWGEFYPTIVDNFESYDDDWENPDNTIWETWIDGLFVWTSGSMVGYVNPPFAETIFVHGGVQAMPLFYDNDGKLFEGEADEVSGVPYFSETQRTWDEPQDWTIRDVDVLALWLYGEPDNSADTFYVALEDNAGNRKDITHPNPAVLTVNEWQQWRIPLADFTDVDLTAIKFIYIGTGDPISNQPGGSGLVRIDDIELHRSSE